MLIENATLCHKLQAADVDSDSLASLFLTVVFALLWVTQMFEHITISLVGWLSQHGITSGSGEQTRALSQVRVEGMSRFFTLVARYHWSLS